MSKKAKTWEDKEEFREAVRHWANKLDVAVIEVRLRKMKNKWASCSTAGRATFNTELLDIDRKLGEYAIAHELLHVRIPNHGRLFKSLLKVYVPDYQERSTKFNRFCIGNFKCLKKEEI